MVPTGVQIRAGSASTLEIDLRFEGTSAGCEAQIEQTLRIASGARRMESPADVWNAHAELWSRNEIFRVVCKFSALAGGPRSFSGFGQKNSGTAEVAVESCRAGSRSWLPSIGAAAIAAP